ncbi:MAG: transposase [Desulfuromonadaceae bacterium]|nr:transposase [Desulfuromonadaceae bacterium]
MCKYHIVRIPKCRRKVLYGHIRQHLGEVIRELARQRESSVLEGHLCCDHVQLSKRGNYPQKGRSRIECR